MSFTDLTGGLSLLNIVELGQLFDVDITNPVNGQVLTYLNGEWVNGSGGGGGSVDTVTGLNTDNADPVNPVVKISVDGVTVTGQGTPADPLVAVTGGGGSVTDVSVIDANGFSGSVADSTTTPAITLTLNSIDCGTY